MIKKISFDSPTKGDQNVHSNREHSLFLWSTKGKKSATGNRDTYCCIYLSY